MKTVKVIYGSTTGNTERVAQRIAEVLDGTAVPIAQAAAADFEADLLVLGTSTWGLGDIQDDWADGLKKLETASLSGRAVALFGLGDQLSYSTTFVDGMGELYDAVQKRGARVVGQWPTEGYRHDESKAVRDGAFVGLALDDDNDLNLTDARIAKWCEGLKGEIA